MHGLDKGPGFSWTRGCSAGGERGLPGERTGLQRPCSRIGRKSYTFLCEQPAVQAKSASLVMARRPPENVSTSGDDVIVLGSPEPDQRCQGSRPRRPLPVV